jgi:hypothetical protein
MRKYLVLLTFIFIQAVLLVVLLPKALAADTVTHANCLQITVKFNAPAAWQKSSSNRNIQIGCAGQIKPTGARSCEGAVLTLKPGQVKTLGNCSCFNKQGCLKVGKTLSRTKKTENNRWVVAVAKPLDSTLGNKCSVKYVNRDNHKPIKLTSICGTNKQRFNVAINISCSKTTITPTPGICVGPKPVANVKVTCPTCEGQGLTPTPTAELTPTPTLTPTPELRAL